MKKMFAAVALSCVATVSLAACGSSSEPEAASTPSIDVTVDPEPIPSVDVPDPSATPVVVLDEAPPLPLGDYDNQYSVTVPAGGRFAIPLPDGVSAATPDKYLLTLDAGDGVSPNEETEALDSAIAYPESLPSGTENLVWEAGDTGGKTYVTVAATYPDTEQRVTSVVVVDIS